MVSVLYEVVCSSKSHKRYEESGGEKEKTRDRTAVSFSVIIN